jgi:hypothetical protein
LQSSSQQHQILHDIFISLFSGDQVQIGCALSMISSDKKFSDVNLQPVDIMPQRPHHSGITNPFVLSVPPQEQRYFVFA